MESASRKLYTTMCGSWDSVPEEVKKEIEEIERVKREKVEKCFRCGETEDLLPLTDGTCVCTLH